MQDENNSNQPVILNLNPVNDSISQFIQLQTGILSDQEIFIPSESILPVGTRVKIEYRLKSFGQKENVKIIDAVGEVIGPEVDSEKGRRGVRVKFLKLSPTSQVLIQKLLEKIKAAKPSSGEKKIPESTEPPKTAESKEKTDEIKVQISEPPIKPAEPAADKSEPKVQINEPSVMEEHAIPSFSEVMAKLEKDQKKEEAAVIQSEQNPSTFAEIMSKQIEKPQSQEIKLGDDKQAQFVFQYLPPGQPIEENTGIVKIREIVRSTDVSAVKRTSRIWIVLIIIIFLLGGAISFFMLFPQYAPKIFVKSHEVSNVITKRDLTPEIQPTPSQPAAVQPAQVPTQEQVKPEEKKEEKAEEKKVEEVKKEEEKVPEPEIQPLATKEEKVEKKEKEEGVKIISGSKIKKEREKEKKVQEEKEKKVEAENKKAKEKAAEVEKEKTKKEIQSTEPGKIIIQITPTDADLTVFIDGAQAGSMPTLSKQLPAGTHTIKVVADGYNDETRKVDIAEGETKTIKINLKEK